MAASTVYSSLFSTTNAGQPLYNRPHNPGSGTGADAVSYTIATTSLDDIGDFVGLIPVPCGRNLVQIWFNCADLDSNGTPLLDLDIILRVTDKNGVNTDTILFDAGTAFQAAQSTDRVITLANVVVGPAAGGFGVIGTSVVAAAATAASGAINLGALWW